VSDIVCVPFNPLSRMVTVPSRLPNFVGVKVMSTSQVSEGASRLPQVLVWAKSPLLLRLFVCKSFKPTFENGMSAAPLVVSRI
jgi:hypothetical protein